VEKKYDITVAGHICLDIIPKIPETGIYETGELFKPGKLVNVGAAKISTGGPVSNTGIALKKLGLNVAFMSRVGKDELGSLIIKILYREGHIEGVSISEQDRTSYTIAIAPPGIDRIFLHDPGANDRFSSVDLNAEIISQSKLFHFGYPPLMENCYQHDGRELEKIFQIAKSAGAITSLDMALPDPKSPSGKANWRILLEKVLPNVDIFLPSIEEVFFMLDPENYFKIKQNAGSKDVIEFIDPGEYSRLAKICLDLGAKIVALKAAYRGIYVLTSDLMDSSYFDEILHQQKNNWSSRELWCPAFAIDKIASATGSGDSSIAGFLAAFFRGYPIEKTLKYANCVGNQNLHVLDAVSGIKNWGETTTMIEQGNLKMIDLPLPHSNWKFDEKFEIWEGMLDRTQN
jgi:sugar/nucleoside kinase (ribokinase family)